MAGYIIDRCEGCLMPDTRTGKCTVFADPVFQWEGDECWGRVEEPAELVSRLTEMESHNRRHGNSYTAARLSREIEFWQEYV